MACNLFRQIGKSCQKIQNGMLFSLRMCNHEAYRPGSTEQSSNQSEQATTYGAPEYFEYNEYSFNDIHADMDKYRLPRLSCKTSSEEKK